MGLTDEQKEQAETFKQELEDGCRLNSDQMGLIAEYDREKAEEKAEAEAADPEQDVTDETS